MKVTSIPPKAARFPFRRPRPKPDPAWRERVLAYIKTVQGEPNLAVMPRLTWLPRSIQGRLEERFGAVFVCRDCRGVFLRGHHLQAGDRLCDDCSDEWVRLEDTGGMARVDDAYYSERYNAYYSYDRDADDEDDEEEDSPRYPHDYHEHPHRSYKRSIKPNHDDPLKDDPLKIGIEWEYNSESRTEDATRIDATPYAFAERDGSLSCYRGLEIITGYSTLPTVCSWITDLGKMINVEDLDQAGLHVNISGLTRMASAKFMTFMNRPNNADMIDSVTDRWNSTYARVCLDEADLGTSVRRWKYRTPSTDKYSHVNVHDRYLEVRVFESSSDPAVIRARVQFVWALAKFCSDPGLDLTESGFKRWLQGNPWAGHYCHDLFRMVPDLKPKGFSKLKLKEAA